ncbi:MAG: hypothetical protein COT17_03415 [Elusimicrobia bacterium CG08_land_8_20_14_0_20_51_18]|nr:MAG: hypothetical protein COT17_03415 [Elusimicrobia bacterium CG08_land_8_20_14_0_20_51_18]
MKNIIISISLSAFFLSCSHTTEAEREQQKRADLELQSVMQMVMTKNVPPIDFEFNSAELKASSYELLDKVFEILDKYPKLKLIVEGHTDDVGGDAYNKKLSLMRADAIKTYLVRRGIHPDSVRIYGYGESVPVLAEKTEEARALNRRVEFRITTRDWATVY